VRTLLALGKRACLHACVFVRARKRARVLCVFCLCPCARLACVRVRVSVWRVLCVRAWGGWGRRGVRCRADVMKGMFVCEYVGDVVTDEMGALRGLHYDNDMGRSYLFDLDFFRDQDGDSEAPRLTLDGSRRGNVCRFINHVRDGGSCVFFAVCVCVGGGG
jgi:hypothetical protein